MSHLTNGLEMLTMIPESAERIRHTLDVLVLLGVALIATKGQAVPAVKRGYLGRANWVGRWRKLRTSSQCCLAYGGL
jgi:hypothetical protein